LRRSIPLAALLLLSLALNAVLLSAYFTQLSEAEGLRSALKAYATEVEGLYNRVAQLSRSLNLTLSQLEFYRRVAEAGSNATVEWRGEWALSSSTVNLVAVKSTPEGGLEGVVLKCEVKLLPGEGRVLVDIEPKIGIDLQASVKTAVGVAEEFTGQELSKVDVVVRVISKEAGIEVVDGPSAGAAITAAVISAIRGEELNSTVYVTGTINPDGSIGWVGGVLEKALAAAENGASLFVVPRGQRVVEAWKVVKSRAGPFIITRYEPVYVDVGDFLLSRGFKVKVVEAGNIGEVYSLLRAST